MNILRNLLLDSDSRLSKHFLPYQVQWIQAEKAIHDQRKQAVALAEKSVRVGWTYADGFKNVRKRIFHKNRDYLFATKDYPSALEYVRQCYKFAEIFDLTRNIISHGEESLRLNTLDDHGQPSRFTEDVKIGVIKFDNGSRIIAFSANPQAMSVYGGDVGLDEFAKHPNARLLWETAQGRVAWNYDLAVWSSHNGQDTLFNEFAQEARSEKGPWNIYFRVTMPEAIRAGLVDTINRVQGTAITGEQFLADCRSRARNEEIYQQSYLCNPKGAETSSIVDWSAIERCRADYQLERVHLEADQVRQRFGEFNPARQHQREDQIADFLRTSLPRLCGSRPSTISNQPSANCKLRLGFDVAACGQGDLAVIYIDEVKGSDLWLSALFTCRTEDWHFLKTVLFYFLKNLRGIQAAGDETGLGRQICWEAAKQFGSRFLAVNFNPTKDDLGFALMNQLSLAQKRFPRSEQDIAADYFALRKIHTGTRWTFTEGPNSLNPASHCDIAWAGALASHAHTKRKCEVFAMVDLGSGWSDGKNFHPYGSDKVLPGEAALLWSDDPSIWTRWK